MTDKVDNSRGPSRRTVLGTGTALLGAISGGIATPAKAELVQLSLPERVPACGYYPYPPCY